MTRAHHAQPFGVAGAFSAKLVPRLMHSPAALHQCPTGSVGRKWPGHVWPQPRIGCRLSFSNICSTTMPAAGRYAGRSGAATLSAAAATEVETCTWPWPAGGTVLWLAWLRAACCAMLAAAARGVPAAADVDGVNEGACAALALWLRSCAAATAAGVALCSVCVAAGGVMRLPGLGEPWMKLSSTCKLVARRLRSPVLVALGTVGV